MISSFDLGKMVGLCEGEGCFFLTYNPRRPGETHALRPQISLILSMTDRDVVEWIAKQFGKNRVAVRQPQRENNLPFYRTSVHGSLAIQWMMTLYPHLGQRRQRKIRSILETWKHAPAKITPFLSRQHFARMMLQA